MFTFSRTQFTLIKMVVNDQLSFFRLQTAKSPVIFQFQFLFIVYQRNFYLFDNLRVIFSCFVNYMHMCRTLFTTSLSDSILLIVQRSKNMFNYGITFGPYFWRCSFFYLNPLLSFKNHAETIFYLGAKIFKRTT